MYENVYVNKKNIIYNNTFYYNSYNISMPKLGKFLFLTVSIGMA